MPYTPGVEACGVVTAVGPGLTGRKVGDLVAYAGKVMGSYAEEQILPADKVVSVPSSIDPVVAASVMLKGMTAQFLVRRCFKVEPGHTVLVHAAAGWSWAAQAKDDGCHHIVMYKDEDFVTRVNEITSGQGVNVVYDSVGKDTFRGSLACLKSCGYMVCFGQSSGTVDPLPLSALAAKSLFLTRPSLFQYTATRDELLETAGELFAIIASGAEAVGVVTAIGTGVTARKVGDLVAYAGIAMGSYAEEQIIPADKVVPVPSTFDPVIAASVMLKGMTAQMLVRRCFQEYLICNLVTEIADSGSHDPESLKVEPGHTVLVHAAAGGCHHIIMYKEEDFVSHVNGITSGRGINVVYDSVGKDTFQGSLECLKSHGYMVCFGHSSGTVDALPLSALEVKSLFLTMPSIFEYTATLDELQETAGEVFASIASRVL
ncbi:hypothetical protein F0562_031410 [Nyssa sinensis]|uniref:Enoyl reductase (ER) domain-containing protein n=1 Tax=Nyssa sinensis TaxID=561372 RepID=A0A5J5ASC4_9ASTE|nr:hypothetical protein F0562_031410 [Nyssa sinensis]